MSNDQFLKLWMIIAVISLVILIIGATTNKVVVYRNYKDLSWSLSIVLSPVIGFLLLTILVNPDQDFEQFTLETTLGRLILGVTALIVTWSIYQNFLFSIADNGVVMGLLIGILKLLTSIFISVFAIGLLNYLFRDQRKLGHIAIFFMLFASLGWFIKTLVNGDRNRTHSITD